MTLAELSDDPVKSLSKAGTLEQDKREIKKEIKPTAKKKDLVLNETASVPDKAISFKSLSHASVLAAEKDLNGTSVEVNDIVSCYWKSMSWKSDPGTGLFQCSKTKLMTVLCVTTPILQTNRQTQNASSLTQKPDPVPGLVGTARGSKSNGTVSSVKKSAPSGKPKLINDAILIGVAAGLALLFGIIAACCWGSRRSKRSRKAEDDDGFDEVDITSKAPGDLEPHLGCKPHPMPGLTFMTSPTESKNSTEPRTQNSTDPRPRRSFLPPNSYARSVASEASSTRSFPVVRAYTHHHQEPSRQSYQSSFFSEQYDVLDEYYDDIDKRESRSQVGRCKTCLSLLVACLCHYGLLTDWRKLCIYSQFSNAITPMGARWEKGKYPSPKVLIGI